MNITRAPEGAAFEECEAVWVKEDAVAFRQPHRTAFCAVVDHAEQDEKLRPGTVTLIHRVRKERCILAQTLIKARK